ncbi:MAG: hypothetical protein ACM3TR_11585 [Caulobacteraceae bacterium]
MGKVGAMMRTIRTSYKDLCGEIEIQQNLVEEIGNEIKQLKRLIFAHAPKPIKSVELTGMPKGSPNYMSLDRIISRLDMLELKLEVESEILEKKIAVKRTVEYKLSKLEGLEHRVYYLWVVEGKTQEEIAQIIDRSKRTVERICSKFKNVG